MLYFYCCDVKLNDVISGRVAGCIQCEKKLETMAEVQQVWSELEQKNKETFKIPFETHVILEFTAFNPL